MSNRTLIELNHDYCIPQAATDELLVFARAIMAYMRAADPAELPPGVRFLGMRHHSDPSSTAERGFNEGIDAAVSFMRARAEKIRTEGAGNVSLMMARIYDDEAASLAAIKRPESPGRGGYARNG